MLSCLDPGANCEPDSDKREPGEGSDGQHHWLGQALEVQVGQPLTFPGEGTAALYVPCATGGL